MQVKTDTRDVIAEYGGREIRFPYFRYQYHVNAAGLDDESSEKEWQDAAVRAARNVCDNLVGLEDDEVYHIVRCVVDEVDRLGNSREPSPTS